MSYIRQSNIRKSNVGISLLLGTQVGKWCKQLKIKNLRTYRLCMSLPCKKKILYFWYTSVLVDLCLFLFSDLVIHCSFSNSQHRQNMRNLAQSCSVFTRDFSHIQLLTGLLKICVHCYFLWLVCTYVFPILAIIIEISSQELINWLCCQLCQVFCKLWSEKYSSVLLKGLFKSCKTKNNFWKPWQGIVAQLFL